MSANYLLGRQEQIRWDAKLLARMCRPLTVCCSEEQVSGSGTAPGEPIACLGQTLPRVIRMTLSGQGVCKGPCFQRYVPPAVYTTLCVSVQGGPLTLHNGQMTDLNAWGNQTYPLLWVGNFELTADTYSVFVLADSEPIHPGRLEFWRAGTGGAPDFLTSSGIYRTVPDGCAVFRVARNEGTGEWSIWNGSAWVMPVGSGNPPPVPEIQYGLAGTPLSPGQVPNNLWRVMLSRVPCQVTPPEPCADILLWCDGTIATTRESVIARLAGRLAYSSAGQMCGPFFATPWIGEPLLTCLLPDLSDYHYERRKIYSQQLTVLKQAVVAIRCDELCFKPLVESGGSLLGVLDSYVLLTQTQDSDARGICELAATDNTDFVREYAWSRGVLGRSGLPGFPCPPLEPVPGGEQCFVRNATTGRWHWPADPVTGLPVPSRMTLDA